MGWMYECREQIRSHDVDGEHMLDSIDRFRPRFAVPDAGVMDDGIERSDGVGLVGQDARLSDTRQIADDHVSRAGYRFHRLTRTVCVARMQDDLVVGGDEALRGHLPKTVGGAGDENASHHLMLPRRA